MCSDIIEQENIFEKADCKKAVNTGVKPSTAQVRPGGRQTTYSTPKQGTKKPRYLDI